MVSSRRLPRLVLLAALGLLAVALLAPGANAANIPPLSSSAQYKALVRFVDKLHGLANTPTPASQKAAYEGQLESKHDAAVVKSTALFNRAKGKAKAEADRAFKAGARVIRRTEAGELAGLRRQYDRRMRQAAATHQAELDRNEAEFNRRAASLRKQIKRLRKRKANATSAGQKALIEAAIQRRRGRIASDRKLEAENVADLNAGYRKEKRTIRAAKASATHVVERQDNRAIQRLRSDHQRIFKARVQTLQSKRANELGELHAKLDEGRAAIALIPVSG